MQDLKPKGFTLIELMITMTIIGFLAVLTLSLMPKYVQKAQDSKRDIIINEIFTIIKLARETKIITGFDLNIFHEFKNKKTGEKVNFHDLLLDTSDFSIPSENSPQYDYIYVYSDEYSFAILNCSNANRNKLVIKGNSLELVKELQDNSKTICPEGEAPSRNRFDFGEEIFGMIITNGQSIDLQ